MESLSLDDCGRADRYKLLADCYYLPDEALAEKLHGLARQSAGPAGELCRSFDASDDIESLQVDFSRLFVGPFQLLAPPYGSLYLEGDRVMGESTMDVQRLYRDEGLDVVLKDVPDHVCAELEFMSFLIRRGMECEEAGDQEETRRYRQKQMSFLDVHLGAWVEQFAEKVCQGADTDFHKTLGRLTASFVEGDARQLRDGAGGWEPQEEQHQRCGPYGGEEQRCSDQGIGNCWSS